MIAFVLLLIATFALFGLLSMRVRSLRDSFHDYNILLLLSFVVTALLYIWMPNHQVEEQSVTPIFSAALGSGSSGGFVLGTGKVDSDAYYYFYREEEGFLQLQRVRASSVLLDMRDDQEPAFIERSLASQNTLKKILFWPIPPMLPNLSPILVVPTDAVVQQFDLNLMPGTV